MGVKQIHSCPNRHSYQKGTHIMATPFFPENIQLDAEPHIMLVPRIPFNFLRDEMLNIDPEMTWPNYYAKDQGKWTYERRLEAMMNGEIDPRLKDTKDIAQPIKTRIPAETVIQTFIGARETAMGVHLEKLRSVRND